MLSTKSMVRVINGKFVFFIFVLCMKFWTGDLLDPRAAESICHCLSQTTVQQKNKYIMFFVSAAYRHEGLDPFHHANAISPKDLLLHFYALELDKKDNLEHFLTYFLLRHSYSRLLLFWHNACLLWCLPCSYKMVMFIRKPLLWFICCKKSQKSQQAYSSWVKHTKYNSNAVIIFFKISIFHLENSISEWRLVKSFFCNPEMFF